MITGWEKREIIYGSFCQNRSIFPFYKSDRVRIALEAGVGAENKEPQ